MYHGFYINLDRNEARRRALEAHLEERGATARYRRIQAVDGREVAHQYPLKLEPGALGCWLSHVKAVQAGCEVEPKTHLHVIEDDTIFARQALLSFDRLLEAADANLGGWDLIFTDIYVSPADFMAHRDISRTLKAQPQTKELGLLDLKRVAFSGTSSIFVNRQSVDKYAGLLAALANDPVPIDLHIRRLAEQGLLRAYATIPFLTSVSPDSTQSDVSGQRDASRAVFDIVRRSLFQDAQLTALDAEMQQLIEGLTPTPREVLYFKSLLFMLSERYKPF